MQSRSLPRRDWLRLSTAGAFKVLGVPAVQARTRLPRLVTVSGAITEVVYLLGAQEQLVGTDTTSLYPMAAQQTPKVGYMRQLSDEGRGQRQPSSGSVWTNPPAPWPCVTPTGRCCSRAGQCTARVGPPKF